MDERLTLAQAAALAGLKPVTLRAAINRGRLQHETEQTPRGPVHYVTKAWLDAYLASRSPQPRPGREEA